MNKKFKKILILVLSLGVFAVGCSKETDENNKANNNELKEEIVEVLPEEEDNNESKNIDIEKNSEDNSLRDTLGLSVNQLMDIKTDGIEEKNDEGKIVSLHYIEDFFGVENVETSYYFSDDADEVAAINLYFNKDQDIDTLMKNISLELGQADLEEEKTETSGYRAEWVTKDNIYYSLMDYGEFIEFSVIELIGD